MGTTVTIEAAGADAAAIDRAFGWFRTVEQVCTRFDVQSELCSLTRQSGTAVPVSALLFEAVRFALHVAELSEGAFDPTLGAVMHMRGFDREHRSGAAVPSLAEASRDVTYLDVALDEARRTITLRRPLLLDLGAVAKGLAIDLAARELQSARSVAIDAGGDLYLGGTNTDGDPWSIGIRHPRLPGQCIAAVQVSDRAVCTSGDYERPANARSYDGPAKAGHYTSGQGTSGQEAQHHILDPRTASSPGDVASVTVIAASAMLADALGTAAFVMGPDRGLALLDEAGVEGLIVTRDLRLRSTAGWPGLSIDDSGAGADA